ncbi:MAG: hybrid sensor histidine kinase/response regulator, partial [bacterium]|nr:hybrid sensor histidine kinase/response regulator [bacterium]
AEDGLSGVAAARSYRPDLIVCDIMMPGILGYEVLETLRQEPQTSTIPFIFLTAKIDRTDMRHGMGLGADDYVTKPFMVSELLDTIRARLEKRAVFDRVAQDKIKVLTENIITALPHELRTPLNTILGFSDMLMMEAKRLEPVQITEWSQHINEAAMRLYRLIENYLTYVRVEVMLKDTDRIKAVPHRHVVPEGIIQMQSMLKAQQHNRTADLKVNTQNGFVLPMTEQDFNKIVEELVDNAFKFSQPGTVVEVNGCMQNNHYVLTVHDFGRGLKPEQIEAIGPHMQFERWFYEHQGSGLGLIIARRMAELYGGDLTVQSIPEKETTVTVRLPLE